MINDFIQKRFLKKRYIFQSSLQVEYSNKNYEFKNIDEIKSKESIFYLEKKISKEKYISRMENPDIKGFVVVNKKTNEIVGYQWLLYSPNKEYRHDNYTITPNTGFLFNAYVDPNHRGKGVFTLLKSEIVKYYYNKTGSYNLLSIVESLNHSSVKVNKKLGSIEVGENFLLKIWGRNILVFTRQNNQLTISLASKKRI